MRKLKASTNPAVSTESTVDLRQNLAAAIPFEVGLTEFEGETWQLILPLTTDTIPESVEKHLRVEWKGRTVGNEKWLFLHVASKNKAGLSWAFAFDCNEPEVSVFLRHVLSDNRLMIAFPNQNAIRIENAAGTLAQELMNNDSLDLRIRPIGIDQVRNIEPVRAGTG